MRVNQIFTQPYQVSNWTIQILLALNTWQHKLIYLQTPDRKCSYYMVIYFPNPILSQSTSNIHNLMAWKCFLHYGAFVRGIRQSLVVSLHKRSVMSSFDVCLVVNFNKLLNNQLICQVICDALLFMWCHCHESMKCVKDGLHLILGESSVHHSLVHNAENIIEGNTKWLPFCRWHIQIHLLQWKLLCFDSNFIECCSLGSNL